MSLRTCLTLLALGFAAQVAAAENDAAPWLEPVAAQPVDDATLGATRGKFYGANMLVGVRIDLVSSLATGQGGQATGQGSLYIMRTADGGFDVRVDTQAGASANGAGAVGNALASGGDGIRVDGIGQVTQIAGDGNRMGNTAVIRVVDSLAAPDGFNGRTTTDAQAGAVNARVSFADGGLRIGLAAPGASVGQGVTTNGNGAGQVMQYGRIAGSGFTGSNALQMQILSAPLTTGTLMDLGIQQAISVASGLRP